MIRCPFCFGSYPDFLDICPSCGILPADAAGLPVRPGMTVGGRYFTGALIGRGGFGCVFTAQDIQNGERVAVKACLPGDDGDGSRAVHMLLDQARQMGEMSGLGIFPEIYDCFEENGTAFIVMKELKGKTLSALIKESAGGLPRDTALGISVALCEVLGRLHAAGRVHGDIAPDNIFLLQTDSPGDGWQSSLRLLDPGAQSPSLKNGFITVKKGYTAPEMYSGCRPSVKSDIWSLGAVVYTLYTGKVPKSEAVKKADGVPPAVLKAMAENPGKRPDSVSAFINSITGKRSAAAESVKHDRQSEPVRVCGITDDRRTVYDELYGPLEPGCELSGRFVIRGEGFREGCCWVTCATDRLLRKKVLISEFFPENGCKRAPDGVSAVFDTRYGSGEASWLFLENARRLMKYRDYAAMPLYYAAFFENGTAYLVSEYPAGTRLADADTGFKITARQAEAVWRSVDGLLRAMHSDGVIHGNISPESVFIKNSGELLVGGFTSVYYTPCSLTPHIGAFSAPELKEGRASPESDIYSAAACVYRLLTGRNPYGSAQRCREFSMYGKSEVGPVGHGGRIMKELSEAMSLSPSQRCLT